ncbi:MAG TPA: 30S ribosome-binding factor RbfA [Aeromonadales bacterium]|nr:30S ribosome-binding factor RbfA [Aeromonadales bacterium]
MSDYSRTDRVGDQILRELAQCLQREVRDPRLTAVTVTAVKLSRDLKYARIYVTFMGKESAEDIKEGLQALDKAKGFLRTYIGREMRLRIVPELSFVYDESIIRGAQLTELIDKAVKSDRAQRSEEDSEDDPASEEDASAS